MATSRLRARLLNRRLDEKSNTLPVITVFCNSNNAPSEMSTEAPKLDPANTKIKLTYDLARGPAEPLKLALLLGGFTYETCSISADKLKEALVTTRTGLWPILEVNGRVVAEGEIPCLKAVGRLNGDKFYPESSHIRTLRVHEIFGQQDALTGQYVSFKTATDEAEKEATREKLVAQILQVYATFEKHAAANGKDGWLLSGSDPSIADIQLAHWMDAFLQKEVPGLSSENLGEFTNLVAIRDRVFALPPIKDGYTGDVTF